MRARHRVIHLPVVCRNYFRHCLAPLCSGISWLALASAWFSRPAFILAPANFVRHLGIYCHHANFFPGRAGQSRGVVSDFLSRYPCRSYAGRAHAFLARPRSNVGDLGGNLPDRFPGAAFLRARDVRAQLAMVCRFCRRSRNCLRHLQFDHDQRTRSETNRSASVRPLRPLHAESSILICRLPGLMSSDC